MKPVVALMMQCSETVPGAFEIDPGYERLLEYADAQVLHVNPSYDDAYLIDMLDQADGLMIPGGNDINPEMYGGKALPSTDELVPSRDHAEPVLLAAAYKRHMPYLGICRGLQMMCVLAGGDLYQQITDDMPNALNHWQRKPFNEPSHEVIVTADSPLHGIVGTTHLQVNSMHHQAVRHPGQGVVVQASAPDGIIESAYRPDREFFMAVQWHPEQTPDEKNNQQLAIAFVDACRRCHEGRAAYHVSGNMQRTLPN